MQSESTTASTTTAGASVRARATFEAALTWDVVDVTQATLNQAIRDRDAHLRYRLHYMAIERRLWDAATQRGCRSINHRLETQQGDTAPEVAYYARELAKIGQFRCVEARGHPAQGCACQFTPFPKHRDSDHLSALAGDAGCVRYVIINYDDDAPK